MEYRHCVWGKGEAGTHLGGVGEGQKGKAPKQAGRKGEGVRGKMSVPSGQVFPRTNSPRTFLPNSTSLAGKGVGIRWKGMQAGVRKSDLTVQVGQGWGME